MEFADFVLVLAVVGAIAAMLQAVANRFAVPHLVLLALLGIGLGALARAAFHFESLGPLTNAGVMLASLDISSEAILTVFLPILLFQTGLTVDVRRMIDDIGPILLLAIVAVLVCIGVVGVALWGMSDRHIVVCLLLGAIVATTDPVAVVGIFRDVGAPRRLTILVEGESLFNDAAAIVVFVLMLGILTEGTEPTVFGALGYFFYAFLGGALVGAVGARLAIWLIGPMRGLPLAEITMTLSTAYAVYIVGEEYLEVSGVVAVVMAALAMGSAGRTRFSPETWQGLMKVWEQLGFWAATLIFIFASMRVTGFLQAVTWEGVGLLIILVVAALVARAMVLWGLLPALSRLGLGEVVTRAYKLVILWGGLRGAVTLALALAVTEHPLVPADVKQFVALLATGFVLFTLLINATTLRPVLRLLGLNRLGPVESALRNRAIALSLSEIGERIDTIAEGHHIPDTVRTLVRDAYESRRTQTAAGTPGRLSEAEQLNVGLIALANREEELYLHHFADRTLSRRATQPLLAKAGRLRDGVKESGHHGYLAAASDSRRFRWSFRIALYTHRRFRVESPLANKLADRFEMLLVTRMVIDELLVYLDTKLIQLLEPEIGDQLRDVLHTRRKSCVEALSALRLQYPDYARALEERFLRNAALRLEESEYRALFAESVISQEIFRDLYGGIRSEHQALEARPPLDLGLDTETLVRRFAMFSGLSDADLRSITEVLRPRFAYPGERLMTQGERGDFMLFISSGAVEVTHLGRRFLVGPGDFVGELALLTFRRRTANVTAVDYCRFLQLNGRDFRRFLKAHPELRAQIRAVADRRLGELSERQQAAM